MEISDYPESRFKVGDIACFQPAEDYYDPCRIIRIEPVSPEEFKQMEEYIKYFISNGDYMWNYWIDASEFNNYIPPSPDSKPINGQWLSRWTGPNPVV